MKGALLLALLIVSPENLEMPTDMAYACADAYSYCVIKKEALRELIHERAERPCWNRST